MIAFPPTEFTFGKYGIDIIPWVTLKSTDNFAAWLLNQNIIGYCNSMEVEIRPRPDCISVMFEDEDGWQGWTHIPTDVWTHFLDVLKRR